MKLTKDQFVVYLGLYEEMYRQSNDICSLLCVQQWLPDDWTMNYYRFLEAMCELTVDDITSQTVLDWYCFEADFGKNITTDTSYTKYSHITNAEQLYEYILEKEHYK